MKDFFAKKPPPPEEKIDPVKAKCTLDALKRAPPPPPQTTYEHIVERTYKEAERSGSTCSDRRLAERRSGEKIPQLGEQANQSCPPLKVSSDIVANHPGILSGTNPADYMHDDDAHYDIMEVDEFRYQYRKPLVKPGHPPLTTMMRRFHDWYMNTCRESGKDTLTLKVKEEHDFIVIDLLSISFEEFFQFFNQKALAKLTVTFYCL